MMISPGSYIASEIEGRTREEALKEIKSLRREINRLKKILEEGADSEEMYMHPGPDVRIWANRDYITAAREYFKEQGWKYEPTKEEIKDQEFNDKLDQVESIEVEYGGFLGGGVGLTITFDGEEIRGNRITRPYSADSDMTDKDEFEGMNRTELLDEIKDLHMGEWNHEYENLCVLDGIQWSIVIKYTDGKKWKCDGSNKYPYNFDRFLEVMQIEPIED